MKRFLTYSVFFYALFVLPLAKAQTQATREEQYLAICSVIGSADELNQRGAAAPALEKYREADSALRKLQARFPRWNTNVVSLRLGYVASKIAPLAVQPPAPAPAAPAPPASAAPKPAPTAMPVKTEPGTLAAARTQVSALQKENDSLKSALAQQSRAPQTNDTAALAEAQRKLDAQARASANLIAEANAKLERQTRVAASLTNERNALQQRLESRAADKVAVSQLRTENESLKRQLADSKSKVAAPGKSEELNRQLKQAQSRFAQVESDLAALRSEKTALEERLGKASATAAAAEQQAARNALKVKLLEHERDELQQKLVAATKEKRQPKDKSAAQIQELLGQLAALRAQLDVYEAKPVPYTPEELASFQRPAAPEIAAEAKPADASSPKTSKINATLIAEAHRHFAAGELDKAEDKYTEALKAGDKDVRALSNLATVQAQRNRFDEAEKTIRQALAIDPDDAVSLALLGYLKLREDKNDEALNALGRAAQARPQDPRIQNMLGLALGHKGMRGPAETAFRKALQADPGFADAHANLATIYLTQQPPSVELARWHYQKAVAAGAPKNPELEKKLEAADPASGQK